MITRKEHLAWCKERALAHLPSGDVKNAITSMWSDLIKHPETAVKEENKYLMELGFRLMMDNDIEGARRYIEGFGR